MPYRELLSGLRAARDERLVRESNDGELALFCYSERAVYERMWNDFTLLARGLILDTTRECVVASPFPKFFNLGERDQPIPDLPFDCLEKLDGSLIILWHGHDGWRCATKGSFGSQQAQSATAWLRGRDLSSLRPGYTYLAEYVAPTNCIVVRYECEELVLLAAYDDAGHELDYAELIDAADRLRWRLAPRHPFASVSDLIAHAAALPATQEGFVLRFENGLRLKIKGDEYRRIHALISRCTPLAMWEAMAAGDEMAAIRQQLPEEFWVDFDAITSILGENVTSIVERVQHEAAAVADLSDKDVGLRLNQWPDPIRSFIFPYRKSGGDLLSGKARQALFRAIRPTGNALDGYTPSYAMNRVMDEAL